MFCVRQDFDTICVLCLCRACADSGERREKRKGSDYLAEGCQHTRQISVGSRSSISLIVLMQLLY